MKNIVILILFLFLSIGSVNVFAQANTGKIGSPNTTTIVLGGLQPDSALRVPFLPKNYNYTKGQTTFRQLILATEDTTLYINKGSDQFQVFDQSDTNTTYGPTTPYYVNRQINKIIDDSTLNVKVLGFGLDRADSILFVDTPTILTVNKAAQTYVPNTGAVYDVDLGGKSLTTNKVRADTLQAKSSMGIHMHGTGGLGIMVGAGGGGNITFDAYPTTTTGDSLLGTNSSGGLIRYNMKAKLAEYVTYADTNNALVIQSGSQIDTAKKNIRASIAASSVGGVTSATNGQLLYKSGDTLRGANFGVDTTDKRLMFPANTSTVTVTTPYNGGTKFYNVNTLGLSELIISDTVAIPSALQRSLNAQVTGQVVPTSGTGFSSFGHLAYAGMMVAAAPTAATFATSSESSTSQQMGYPRLVYSTLATANGTATVRCGSLTQSGGIFGGSSKFSSGSGRGTFIFSMPTYLATERFFVGYTAVTSAIVGDPSGASQNNTPLFGLCKDAGDTTFQFIRNDNSGTPTKVNTGVVPNTNDVYRVTCYVSPDNKYYVRLQVLSKTAAPAVYVFAPTSDTPPLGTKLVLQQTINNGTVGGVVSMSLIQIMEELY